MGFTIKTFLKMFQSFSKATLSSWKEVQDNIGTRFWSAWEKFVIDIGEWLRHLSKYCPIFWSYLQFFLIGIIAWNWSVIMEYSLFSDISRIKSWVLWIFVLRMQIQKEKILTTFFGWAWLFTLNVTQQNLFETFAIFFQRHYLASQSKFVECV